MKLYDTLLATKSDFHPIGDEVKLYVCGVTPYAEAHVGHAMSYVIFDVLRRYLEYQGMVVHHVQNFTDVDDKIIARAAEQNISVEELAERYIVEYLDAMDTLRVKRAHIYPRATQEIPQMVEMIETLIERGYAYSAMGDVYYRVHNKDDYGKLSHRTLEGMMAGARIEIAEHKEHPMDFALWKGSKTGEPGWDSPWGAGRPGWHIECSAMSFRYLGETIDIHGGGQDLVFPHHENEIAQSEAYTNTQPFARFWMHNGLLNMGETKMSKSLSNFITVHDAIQQYSVDALRLFFLSSHYRGPLAYSEENITASEQSVERLRNALRDSSVSDDSKTLDPDHFVERFLTAMDDDLNTPQALAALFDLTREINRARERHENIGSAQAKLRELAGILGLTLEQPNQNESTAEPFIELLLETRTRLRGEHQFALADTIRARLDELGVELEDTPTGSTWKFRSTPFS